MKVEVTIDPQQNPPKIIIVTNALTEEIEALVKRLSQDNPRAIVGQKDDRIQVLQPEEIFRLYGANQKVYAETAQDSYQLRLRLYEAEECLPEYFIRISHSEIVNLKKVVNLDLSLAGTIGIHLSNGSNSYVSRRYLSKIKTALGI